jgi:hypothetical protein
MFSLFYKNLKIIFIDFDDTIYPSSFYKNKIISNSLICKTLEDIIFKFFKKCFSITKHVFIISNASKSWIIDCISNNYPKLLSILNIHKNIISAYDLYFNSCHSLNLTKKFTFQYIFNDILLNSNSTYNNIHIISIGDGFYEKKALKNVCINNDKYNKILIIKKNFIFKQLPTDIEIIKQITYLSNTFISNLNTSNNNIFCYNYI